MNDDGPEPRSTDAEDADPRLHEEYVRRVPGHGGAGEVLLAGVVHDHPASTYRVRTLLQREDPDVLALELPPLAVPLYEQYADDDRAPPRFGGEMSAAVQAAPTDLVAGIDGPEPRFLRRLVATLRSEDASLETVREAARRVWSITGHAVRCRLAAALSARTSLGLELDEPTVHEVDAADPPEAQAADERRHVRRATAFTNAVQTGSASRCCDRAREQHMVARLDDLRRDGAVLAVVGIDHLDAVRDGLVER